MGEGTFKVQLALILGGAVKCFLNMLISDSLTTVDPVTSFKQCCSSCWIIIARICTTVGTCVLSKVNFERMLSISNVVTFQ